MIDSANTRAICFSRWPRGCLTTYVRTTISQVLLNWIRCLASSPILADPSQRRLKLFKFSGYSRLFPFFLLPPPVPSRVDRIRCLLLVFRWASSSFIHQRDTRIFYCRGDSASRGRGGLRESSCYAYLTRRAKRIAAGEIFDWRIFPLLFRVCIETRFTRFTRFNAFVGETV